MVNDHDVDFVTVEHTADPHKFLVVVMRYRKAHDDYHQAQISHPLSTTAATALAQSWAAALRLEVR